MKKSLALLLLVAICLGTLVGCNGIGVFYSVKVTGSVSHLASPIMPIYRAGTVVEIKTHIICDAGIYIFVNDEQIPRVSSKDGYPTYSFVMPAENVTIHITLDPFYGEDEYGLDELYPDTMYLELYKDSIDKICIRIDDLTDINGFVENRYSSSENDIQKVISMFDQRVLIAENGSSHDASIKRPYSFYYQDSEFGEAHFYDNYYHWNDFSSYQLFKLKDENYCLPDIESPDLITYSFDYRGEWSYIKRYDDESFSTRFSVSSYFEFVPYDGTQIDTEPTFYIDSKYGNINLLSPTVFELNGEYYEIVSGEGYWAYYYCYPKND